MHAPLPDLGAWRWVMAATIAALALAGALGNTITIGV